VLQRLGHDLTDGLVLLATTAPHRLNQWTGQIDRKDCLWRRDWARLEVALGF